MVEDAVKGYLDWINQAGTQYFSIPFIIIMIMIIYDSERFSFEFLCHINLWVFSLIICYLADLEDVVENPDDDNESIMDSVSAEARLCMYHAMQCHRHHISILFSLIITFDL